MSLLVRFAKRLLATNEERVIFLLSLGALAWMLLKNVS